MYNLIKYYFFFYHFLFIIITIFGWFFNYKLLFLQLGVILSWKFNNNKCLLTEIEYSLFNTTLIKFLYCDKTKKYNDKMVYVPFIHRLFLYLSFLTGFIFYIIKIIH
jgi:hypothetical protein